MIDSKSLDKSFNLTKKFAKELSQKAPQVLSEKTEIPSSGGVYIFYKGKIPLYIGIAKNLRRRIHTDHLSSELRDTMSSLRRSLNHIHKLKFGKAMRDWIVTSCKISFIEIEDDDLRRAVEALLVVSVRSGHLLNKPWSGTSTSSKPLS